MLEEVLKICPDAQAGVPMSGYTTFRVGGPADVLARPKNAGEMTDLLRWAAGRGISALVVGRGSNLLVSDGGVRGLVIVTSGVSRMEFSGNAVRAGCGAPLAGLAAEAARRSLSGLEWAAGIPGTVGGGVAMNAGAHGGEMSHAARRVWIWNGEGVLETDDLGFSYRRSVLTDNPSWALLEAELRLEAGDGDEIRAKTAALLAQRREKQPVEQPSAGSFFKRPPGAFAAELIERCGLKGFSVGGAEVSPKHAGFIVNRGGASCRDIMALAAHIRKTVFELTGAALEPEVRLVGEESWNF